MPSEISGIDLEAFGLQHQLDGLSDSPIVLNQQNAHANPAPLRLGTLAIHG
jgi:hypothetical protein